MLENLSHTYIPTDPTSQTVCQVQFIIDITLTCSLPKEASRFH